MTRVFVFAADALDSRLVSRWRLGNLLQATNGTLKVGRDYFHEVAKMPFSPTIWTSFITGRSPSEHGVAYFFNYGNTLNIARDFFMSNMIGKRVGRFPLVQKLREYVRVRVNRRPVGAQDLHGLTTIAHVCRPSVVLGMPSCDDPFGLRLMVSRAVGKASTSDATSDIWKIHRTRANLVLHALRRNTDWKLFMAYFDLADLIGHIFLTKPRPLMKAYVELDWLAGLIKKELPPHTVFLVVSDHGMQVSPDGVGGVHSDTAFWSLNFDSQWAPNDFTDYYGKIVEWVDSESESLT